MSNNIEQEDEAFAESYLRALLQEIVSSVNEDQDLAG